VDLKAVPLAELSEDDLAAMDAFPRVPTPEDLGFVKTVEEKVYKVKLEVRTLGAEKTGTHPVLSGHIPDTRGTQQTQRRHLWHRGTPRTQEHIVDTPHVESHREHMTHTL
jgi:hypothetical protein